MVEPSSSSSSSLSNPLPPTTTTTNNNSRKRKLQATVQPKNHLIFDPYNSCSTGHQRAERASSHSSQWRETRRRKLEGQFTSSTNTTSTSISTSNSGRAHASSGGEWKWMSVHEARRIELGVMDIRRYMGVSKGGRSSQLLTAGQKEQHRSIATTTTTTTTTTTEERAMLAYQPRSLMSVDDAVVRSSTTTPSAYEPSSEHNNNSNNPSHNNQPTTITATNTNSHEKQSQGKNHKRGIFSTLTFYINGSTYPTISDHKLKRLIADEGGCVLLHLARKAVTHVILGSSNNTTNTNTENKPGMKAGGGLLAAGKLQKEVLMHHGSGNSGNGIKYVTVDWLVLFIPSLPFDFSPHLGRKKEENEKRKKRRKLMNEFVYTGLSKASKPGKGFQKHGLVHVLLQRRQTRLIRRPV